MSVIINTYECDEMMYDYQLVEEEDGTYFVWVSTGPLSGYKSSKDIDSLEEAVNKMFETIKDKEWGF